eukprot:767108-Hanusia_phi.AAC.4
MHPAKSAALIVDKNVASYGFFPLLTLTAGRASDAAHEERAAAVLGEARGVSRTGVPAGAGQEGDGG